MKHKYGIKKADIVVLYCQEKPFGAGRMWYGMKISFSFNSYL